MSVLLGAAVLLSCLPAQSADAAKYDIWTAQKSGTTRALYGVAFENAGAGWAVGAGGTIRHTTDSGATWTGQASGVTQHLRAVDFVNAKRGWAVGDGGVILATVNGGTSWTKQKSGTTNALYAVAMRDASNGWAAGAWGTLLRTTDGGATWSRVKSGTWRTLYGVGFADGAIGWAGGLRGTRLRTVDGGASWRSASFGKKQNMYAVSFRSATAGWEVGSDGMIRRTANAAATWSTLTSGTKATLYGVALSDSGRAWVVGAGGVIRYSGDDGATWNTQPSGTTVDLRGIARSGKNLYAVGDRGTIVASIADVLPPVTKATNLQADDSSGWTNRAVTVTLSATDAQSGVAATYYTIAGAAPQSYRGAFTISAEGRHRVTYWSVDNVGNVETKHDGWANIDTTAPTVSAAADDAWHNTDVMVPLTAKDRGGSGPAGTQYRLQGTTAWKTAPGDAFAVPAPAGGGNDGVHVYEYRAADAAGNVSDIGVCTVRIDTMPAQTTSAQLFDRLTGWSTAGRTVALDATDSSSGVAETFFTLDGGPRTTYTAPFTVTGEGQHQVVYWSVDRAGNVEAEQAGWVNIASVYAEAAGLAADDASQWRNTDATVTITGGGSNAPFRIVYAVDGGTEETVDSPAEIRITGVGHHTVAYHALDSFGTPSIALTGHVNIETTAPETVAAPLPKGWRRTDIVVPLTATDAESGVAATFFRLGDADWTPGVEVRVPALSDHSMDGVHSVEYCSVDAAGNQEAPKAFLARIDTRRPRTKAPQAVTVGRGRRAALKVKVADGKPCAAKASVRIVIKNSKGRVAWQRRYNGVKVNRLVSLRFVCKLPRGAYKFKVYATDRAGNTQSKAASNRITVR